MPLFRPTKPRCKLIRTTTLVAPAGAFNVSWEAADFDDVGGWAGGELYTVDRPGLYSVVASMNRQPVGTGSSSAVRVQVNGLTVQTTGYPSTTSGIQLQCHYLGLLAAGDLINVNATMHGSASSNVGPASTNLTIIRVGPKAWT